MGQHRRPAKPRNESPQSNAGRDTELRVIGGHFRGRKLRYHGDPIVRPMKHRVREAIFNLISTESAGRHAIDLFAGTGALGIEALSRGAKSATFIERHVPSAQFVEQNVAELGHLRPHHAAAPPVRFCGANATWEPSRTACRGTCRGWCFCSPPYSFFVEREADMLDLIAANRGARAADRARW